MKTLVVERTTRVKSSVDIVWDNVKDYTHFVHLHWRHFQQFEVLHDDGTVQVFYYCSRVVPWLGVRRRYIAVRILDHVAHSLRQVYKDLAQQTHVYLRCSVRPQDGHVEIQNTFVFPMGGLLALMPSLFARLVNRRLRAMWHEDREMLTVRYRHGGFTNERCAPFMSNLHADLLANFEERMRVAQRPEVRRYTFAEGDIA